MSGPFEELGLEAVLARARAAINRAKALSNQFTQTPTAHDNSRDESTEAAGEASSSCPEGIRAGGGINMTGACHHDAQNAPHALQEPLPASQTQPHQQGAPSQHTHDTGECSASTGSQQCMCHDDSNAAAAEAVGHGPRPLLDVAWRLAILQQQQKNTLAQLLGLRLEQLRLRQQQLGALQELLRAEAEAVEGTPMQMQAVSQALQLLGQSLEDMDLAATAITATTADGVAQVAQTVSRADQRAEDISRMARQLLTVLREFPRRGERIVLPASSGPRGATEAELDALPQQVCGTDHPLLGELCAICLAEYTPGDTLSGVGCSHLHHKACLHEWLRIRACCPLCKVQLPCSVTVAEEVEEAEVEVEVAAVAEEAGEGRGEEQLRGGQDSG